MIWRAMVWAYLRSLRQLPYYVETINLLESDRYCRNMSYIPYSEDMFYRMLSISCVLLLMWTISATL